MIGSADLTIEYGAKGSWSKAECPFPWQPEKALTFTQTTGWITVFLDKAVPISRAMVLLFMYHETRFSNIRQVLRSGNKGDGVGLAQIEPMNSDKQEFFRTVYGINSSQNESLIAELLANPLTSIRVQCEYYKHKWRLGVNSMRGLVDAQAGGKTQNAPLVNKFMAAEPLLRSAMEGSGNRDTIINALNACSYAVDPSKPGGVVKMAVPLAGFRRYWDFTLPASTNLLLDLRE